MRSIQNPATLAAVGLFLATSVSAQENPKLGRETYYGSGYTERAPEFAQFAIKMSVSCQKSEEAVRSVLEKRMLPYWDEITKKIPGSTETDFRAWGNVANIESFPDSHLVSTPPSTTKEGVFVAGTSKRLSDCEPGKEIPLETAPSKAYRGSLTVVLRSKDMDWVEKLLATVQKEPAAKLPGEVAIETTQTENGNVNRTGTILYDVAQATRQDMRVEVQKQARLAATGPGSAFEKDKKNLRIASAHFLGQRFSSAPPANVSVKMPIEKGKAPVVNVEIPFAYTIYAEAGDKKSGSTTQVGLHSEYRIVGRHTTNADYAEVQPVISASCLLDYGSAADKIKSETADVLAQFEALQAKKPNTETDRVTLGEPVPRQMDDLHFSPVKWEGVRGSDGQFTVLEYWDPCAGKVIPAPKKNTPFPVYYTVSRTLTARSANFKGLLDTMEAVSKKYGVGTATPTQVKVEVGNAMGQVTDKHKQELIRDARENAQACILDPNGSLAADAIGHEFTCVHLKSIRIVADRGFPMPAPGGSAKGRSAPERADALQEAPVETEVVMKDGDLRPRIVLSESERHYAFDYQFQTEDYAPTLKAAAKPLP